MTTLVLQHRYEALRLGLLGELEALAQWMGILQIQSDASGHD
ncbi:MAG: hypothetical protein ACKODN_09930 [Actinomycetota bacterium]